MPKHQTEILDGLLEFPGPEPTAEEHQKPVIMSPHKEAGFHAHPAQKQLEMLRSSAGQPLKRGLIARHLGLPPKELN